MSVRTSINIHPLSLYAHFIEGLWSCIWCIFPIPWKCGHHKIFQVYHIFYSFCKQIFRNSYQYFQSCSAFFLKISAHCKAGSRHAVAMPIHQTYCFTCFYNYVNFYCPKVRWSWVLRAKKVLFHVIKAWFCWEYVFNLLKFTNFNGLKILSNESWIIKYNILKPVRSCSFFTTP